MLNKPDFLVLVARYGGMVIGGLTVYVLHSYYSAKPVAYIYDVGVRKDFQRKGTGIKLIEYLKTYCKEKGFDHAYVEAEADDQQAIDFYTKTKSDSSLHATHFTYELK
ncbi:MAG: GNAT family N-acetyltransferase [Chitinophagaceae bacterium]|nr:GNAT family N-acetyltransferase [Chitinophagaceae bacterium]